MCGGGSRPAPVAAAAPAPKKVDTKKAVDDLTESEKRRKGTKSTILTGGDGVEMEQIKKKKLLGSASETLGNY